MAPKFEIVSPKAGEYRWVLTSQGRTLATSQPYRRRAAAEQAIVSFRMVAVNAPVIDTTEPATNAPTRTAVRTTGRVIAKAVLKGARVVEKTETAVARAAESTKKTVGKAAKSEKGRPRGATKR